ncbi:YbfB/YjiJ family MFS transporter [Kibdelosporangium aridum]|nr:YbfB/YjiJ family MFS transporter [Kibdelosporangium aridum]
MSARQAAAALAAGMGIGRFAYTPILPLMAAQAGLTAQAGASLATANYAGYFVGALACTAIPGLSRSQAVHRCSLVLLVATLAAMPLTHSTVVWLVLRLIAGLASALVFVIAVGARPGWGMGGIGAGIALSGLVVLAHAQWQVAWWLAAGLSALLAVGAWTLCPGTPATSATPSADAPRRWFVALFTSYTLEGVGYIIAATFLVAAINGPLGSGAWVLVGLAAAGSPALMLLLGRRWAQTRLLPVALIIQAAGIALPALVGGPVAALVAAVLFGATFVGIATTTLGIGAHLRVPRAASALTAGYSAGQILGPLLAAPLLHHGYHLALLLASVIVLLGAVAANGLRTAARPRSFTAGGTGS